MLAIIYMELSVNELFSPHTVFFLAIVHGLSQSTGSHCRGGAIAKQVNDHFVLHNLFRWIIIFEPKKRQEVLVLCVYVEGMKHLFNIAQ